MLIAIVSLVLFSPANAQMGGSAILDPPETEDFPIIHSYLQVYDVQGRFVHDLQPGNVTIIEDQKRIPATKINELEVGVKFVVALNLGPSLAIRDSHGVSRYTKIQTAVKDWTDRHNGSLDEFSLLTNDTPDIVHLDNVAQFIRTFMDYQTDPRTATPNLDVLARAINIASDPGPRVGMGRAILLVTPPPSRTNIASLDSIISLARQERIKVNVWMISSTDTFTSEGAALLIELANQTGGSFFAFSGNESIPDIEAYLSPLRFVYELNYESKIRNSEPHQISAEINLKELRIASSQQNFILQVLPPNPIFLSLPLEISRANHSALSETLSDELNFIPREQPIEVLVEFPDGITRPLGLTRLYVDKEIASENSSPPFDQFTWDLSDYTTSSAHLVQVEVIDSLGLSGVSIENEVRITVKQTPQSVISTIVKNAPVIAGATAAAAGGILVLTLIIKGRIKPKGFGRRKEKGSKSKGQNTTDQPSPVEPAVQRRRISYWVNRFSWPQRSTPSQKPVAFLDFLDDTSHSVKGHIPISSGEITIGKDPKLATTVFSDPGVDDLHARLRIDENGEISIHDEGSRAGTWVNYKSISTEDVKLSHGDIIHIGQIGLCLKMTDKNKIPKPIIRSQEHIP